MTYYKLPFYCLSAITITMKASLNTGLVRVETCHMTNGYKRVLKDTIKTYRSAVAFVNHVVVDHFKDVTALEQVQKQGYIEHLVHETKDNPEPEYPLFDKLFYKLPSYMRRAAINEAIGHVQSHETRCDQYYEKRQVEIDRGHHYKRMEPGFSFTPNSCPTLYREQSFQLENDGVLIKVFIRNTWDWIKLSVPSRDLKRLQKAASHGRVFNPKLVYEYHKFYLEFPVKYDVHSFPETPLGDQLVLGVDLGLNHGAACSLMDYYGTVYKRAFSPFQSDMDRIRHQINLIRKYQGMSGKGQSLASLYTKLRGLKENYARQLSRWLVDLAVSCNAYGIVLEHLSSVHRGKRRRGSLNARVHHWCVAKIRDYVKGMAFREGIRVFIVNPKGTSMYAFDGSGKVIRDDHNYSRCAFTTGKQYDCDLNASYNIAARYFLRSLQKSIPATGWSVLKAKVPGLPTRTMWTLSTLKSVSASLPKACAA